MAKSKNAVKKSVTDIRKATGLNQSQFWSRIGVTQSGGSRYEGDRGMPKPARILFELVFENTEEQAIAQLKALRSFSTVEAAK